jgi:hypothetical protein
MVLMFVCCIFSLLLDAPNLLAFLGSKSTRETTKENFSAALEDYVTSLKQAMAQEMLQDSVIAIHQEQGEPFKAYEAATKDGLFASMGLSAKPIFLPANAKASPAGRPGASRRAAQPNSVSLLPMPRHPP